MLKGNGEGKRNGDNSMKHTFVATQCVFLFSTSGYA